MRMSGVAGSARAYSDWRSVMRSRSAAEESYEAKRPYGRKVCLPQWLFRSGRLCQVPKLAPASLPALSATSGTELTA